MEGGLDFRESFKQRVALLKGLPAEETWREVTRLAERKLNPGIRELVSILKTRGCLLAIVSGGLSPIAEHIKGLLGFDYCLSNSLEVSPDGLLSGGIVGEIVDAQIKRSTLVNLVTRNNIDPDLTVAIGDGANDLLMLAEAAYGIAYNAKPMVQKKGWAIPVVPCFNIEICSLGSIATKSKKSIPNLTPPRNNELKCSAVALGPIPST